MTESIISDPASAYGFKAVPADQEKQPPITSSPKPVCPADVPLPSTPLASRIHKYVESKLPRATYLHSLRVYSYGVAIARECYPAFDLTPGSSLDETWFLTAMLHDIGTCPGHIDNTRLSYEFWAGFHAIQILQDASSVAHGEGIAPMDQAESIAEAIIRHQDVQPHGSISVLTRLIHMGTLLDNIGAGRELVNENTITAINKEYPRTGWSGCFKDTVEEEKRLKPYAMVTRIEGFEDDILANGKED